MSDRVLVSIFCIVYNAKNYIKQCLEGFLMQKGNFNFEVLIHDDCSTDGTKKIIEEYAKKYPNIIKPYYEEENQYKKGNLTNIMINMYMKCRGKYIASCDGDDYWCDEYKLQKQVNFMETHPDYALCYHPAKKIYVDDSSCPVVIGKSKYKNPQPYYNEIKSNFILASSVIYKTEYLKSELKDYPTSIYPIDWYNHIVVAKHGKIGYLPDVMYVYRWHNQGISYTVSDNPREELHLKYGLQQVNFSYAIWNKVKDKFPQYYKDIFIPLLRDVCITYLSKSRLDEIAILHKNYSQYFKDIHLDKTADEIYKIEKKYKKYRKYKKLFSVFFLISIILFVIGGAFILKNL